MKIEQLADGQDQLVLPEPPAGILTCTPCPLCRHQVFWALEKAWDPRSRLSDGSTTYLSEHACSGKQKPKRAEKPSPLFQADSAEAYGDL